ncbi:hypothetical protein SSP35_14_01740 [Streptomyces sp. NBRC 110611]|nr:hypothetical protein SSP35_14_01740 [Streptomyces sp. NBRC 110611]
MAGPHRPWESHQLAGYGLITVPSGMSRLDRSGVRTRRRSAISQRYKTPRPNPERVVIEITITHAMGSQAARMLTLDTGAR